MKDENNEIVLSDKIIESFSQIMDIFDKESLSNDEALTIAAMIRTLASTRDGLTDKENVFVSLNDTLLPDDN